MNPEEHKSLTVFLIGGQEFEFDGRRVVAEITASGALIVNCEYDNGSIIESAWPADTWTEYLWEGEKCRS